MSSHVIKHLSTPTLQFHLLPPGLLSVSQPPLWLHSPGFPGEESLLISWPVLEKTKKKVKVET